MSAVADRLIGLSHLGQRLAHERPNVVDAALAAFIALVALAELAGDDATIGRDPDPLGVGLVLAGAASLYWRRRAPLLVLGAVTAAVIPIYLRDYGSYMSAIGVTAIYSASAHGAHRRGTWLTIVAAIATWFTAASVSIMNEADGYDSANAASYLLFCAGAAAAGGIVRNRHEIFVSAQTRAEHAEATRRAEAERAVARERLRIARDMHDVVAHGMSVTAVQAAAAQEITHTDPDRAATVMRSVETTAREALNEMRRMLGVLRDGDDAATGLAPQPSLADVANVVAQSNDAGVRTTLEVTGQQRDLAPGIELAAFRIVQEALTNVRKHAGRNATAAVHIGYRPATLAIEIVDDGAGAASSLSHTGTGEGLIGMRERVDIYHGEITAGPRIGGGYEVAARLPLPNSDEPSPSPSAPEERA